MHRVALKPIGSAGVVPWQGIADALLISNFFLSHITETATPRKITTGASELVEKSSRYAT